MKQDQGPDFKALTLPAGWRQIEDMLVEFLVAGIIVSVSVLGLSSSFSHLGKAKQKVEQTANLIDLEGSTIASFSDPTNFSTKEIKDSLLQGTLPANFTLRISVGSGTKEHFIDVPLDQEIYLNRNLEICKAPNGEDCIYTLKINARDRDVGTAAVPSFAYSMSVDSKLGIAVSLGANKNFEAKDYNFDIPRDFFLDSGVQSCTDTEMIVTGIDRDTGKVICLQKPSNVCPAGQGATGLSVKGASLILDCADLPPSLSCSDDRYALQALNISGSSANGSCIYAGAASGSAANISSEPNKGFSASVCPPDYEVDTTAQCQVVQTKNTITNCTHIEYEEEDVGGLVGPMVNPSNPSQTCMAQERRWKPVTVIDGEENFDSGPSATTPRVTALKTHPDSRSTDCTLQIPKAVCGATWEGYVEYTPTCKLSNALSATTPATAAVIEVK